MTHYKATCLFYLHPVYEGIPLALHIDFRRSFVTLSTLWHLSNPEILHRNYFVGQFFAAGPKMCEYVGP